MRIIIAFYLAILSNSAYSEPDIYQWCQSQIDGTKYLASLSLDNLALRQKKVAYASSVGELNDATGKNLDDIVSSVQDHQKISKVEAEIQTFKLLKSIEMAQISQAINMQGISNEKIWHKVYVKCINDNQ